MGRSTVNLRFPPLGWHFSEWQKQVWRDSEDLRGFDTFDMNCGRGAGKDIIAIRCAIRDAFKLWKERAEAREQKRRNPSLRIPKLEPLVKVFVVAPHQDNLEQPWADWEGELRNLALEWNASWLGAEEGTEDSTATDWLFRHVVRESKFVVFGRGEIEVEARLSSTRDSLRGPGVDIAHWTEFATETTEGEIDRAYDQELVGTLTRAGRLGRVYRTTTPKGLSGAYHDRVVREFGRGVVDVRNGSLRSIDGRGIHYNFDSFQNNFLTEAQLAKIRGEASMGWIFEQERLARFVIGDRGGSRVFERETVWKNLIRERRANRSRNIVVGVDISRLGEDSTVFVILDFDSGDVLRVERYQTTTGPEIKAHIERIAAEFGLGATEFVMDQTAHQAFVGDFVDPSVRITSVKFQDRDKERMVLNLRHLLQIGRVHPQDHERFSFATDAEREAAKVLIEELMQFLKIVDQHGKVRYSAPRGGHDDTVMAFVLAVDPIAQGFTTKAPGEGLPPNIRALLGA